MSGSTQKAFQEAVSNPHPDGSMAAAWWDLSAAVQALLDPLWDWLGARSVKQLGVAIVASFAVLVALSVVAGSFVPLAFGVLAWFVGGYSVGRGRAPSR